LNSYQTEPRESAKLDGRLVDLREVVKTYQGTAGTFTALKGVNLQVEAGAFVSIIGKSGSGKSTLINVFTGIDHPTDGEAIVAGTRLRDLSEGQIAQWRGRTMGIVFQFFQLLPTLTLAENVLLPMDLCDIYAPAERCDRAMHVLEQVGLAGDAHKFPSSVSGGQQQRAAIARALANDPAIIVADEPTGNLDSRAAETIFSLFAASAAAGKTVVMVTHDDELAARAQRKVTLVDGSIA
jgi:putative ABC transport system ATP-binding protein